jgi:hypothetical protein
MKLEQVYALAGVINPVQPSSRNHSVRIKTVETVEDFRLDGPTERCCFHARRRQIRRAGSKAAYGAIWNTVESAVETGSSQYCANARTLPFIRLPSKSSW